MTWLFERLTLRALPHKARGIKRERRRRRNVYTNRVEQGFSPNMVHRLVCSQPWLLVKHVVERKSTLMYLLACLLPVPNGLNGLWFPQLVPLVNELCNGLLHAQFEVLLTTHYFSFQDVITTIDAYLGVIENVRKLLRKLQSEVEDSHKKYQIASTVSLETSIAGGVAYVAGILLFPFTAGLSIAVAVGGMAATVGGGVGSMATNFYNDNKKK